MIRSDHHDAGGDGGHLDVALVLDVRVRDGGEVGGAGKGGDLEPFVDAEALGGVGLDDMDGAGLDEVAEGVPGLDRLADVEVGHQAHAGADRPAHRGHAVEVLAGGGPA